MAPLLHQRCFNHSLREAAARCPECGRFFCRECVTEHDDRVVCAACLRQLVQPRLTQRSGFVAVVRTAQTLAGVLMVWLFFYLLGQMLVSLPDSFHEGTLWKGSWLDEGESR
ncbi:MAG: rhomboid family protein [Verrucomicrobia bacterium]|nr:rhomboid family protein [Verrucomicrobiota bacterium]